jgi:hypothetical protein
MGVKRETSIEEHGLKVFVNMVLRRIFGLRGGRKRSLEKTAWE